MARAAFRVKELRAELIKCTLRQLSIECTTIVSPNTCSILRNTTAEGIQNLSLQDVCNEWKQQTPALYSFLMTTASPSQRNQQRRAKKLSFPTSGQAKDNYVEHYAWLPSVAVAGSILLKQRCRSINAVQLMLMMLIKYSGFQVCYLFSVIKYSSGVSCMCADLLITIVKSKQTMG